MKLNFHLKPVTLIFTVLLFLQVQSANAQSENQSGQASTGNFTEIIDRKIPPADIHLIQQFISESGHAVFIKNDPSDKIYILDNDGFKGQIAEFRALGKDVLIRDKNAIQGMNPTYFLTIDGYHKLENSCEAIVNVHTTENGQREVLPATTQKLTKTGSTWSTHKNLR